ncbi:hypothetical protein QFC22_003298 [Naganishia vaughanmartiniae]|uniref:Uncharacterized protein n=1 Tax=Naganishia vaughanmartiniae TaxID=1424756 RepID=A0ACC2X6A1_9TREE|nr:hypothetical protein QFC22_003298 [Naganishia vaughanmartiniae]
MAPTGTASSTSLPAEAQALEKYFVLDKARLNEIVAGFRREFEDGLKNFGRDTAMIPSYCLSVPNGTEIGTFLALDLGGTNLRVCEVKLTGNHDFTVKQQKYKVSEALKHGDAKDLFNYIAESVDAFMTEVGTENGEDEAVHLGFTFSFPVEQTALDKGKLLTWTKGFACKNAIGHDVVKLLQDALDAKHIKVKCSALVNDTVGTLLSRSYQHGPALIGAIFGTGTNGAYIDRVETIEKLGKDAIAESLKGGPDAGEFMVINTEWGAIDNGRHVLPVSPFDNKLDRESINPRKQAFEKMVSGMYLGEIVRNMLLYLIDFSVLFDGHSSSIMNTHYGLDTALVSEVEDAKSDDEVLKVLTKDLGMAKEVIKPADVQIFKWACRMVSSRAASLSACALAAVVLHTGQAQSKGADDTVDIGMDGRCVGFTWLALDFGLINRFLVFSHSVAEFLPHFEERMRAALRLILGDEGEKRIKMGLAKDGSGVGAALCALQAKKAEDASVHPVSRKMDALVP